MALTTTGEETEAAARPTGLRRLLASKLFLVLALSLAANLGVYGRVLLTDRTLAASASTRTVLSQCRATGAALTCAAPISPSDQNDSGAAAWVEMADDAYLHRAQLRGEPRPAWNPFVGSGYPVALDGHGGRTSPTRWLLAHAPGEQSRDVLVFARMLLYTAGVLTALALLGAGVWVLAPLALVAALSPYGTGVLDHVMLDVDLLSPWTLVLLIALATGRLRVGTAAALALGLGLFIGALGFHQAQATECVMAGLLSLLAVGATRGRSLAVGAGVGLGFLCMAFSWLPLVQHLDQFMTSRGVLCMSARGAGVHAFFLELVGASALNTTGPAATAAALVLLPFVPRQGRFVLLAVVLVGAWLVVGLPQAACSLPFISGVRFSRHLAIQVQTLLVVGIGTAAMHLAAEPSRPRTRLVTLSIIALALSAASAPHGPLYAPQLVAVVACSLAAAGALLAARRATPRGSTLAPAVLSAALALLAVAPWPFASRFAAHVWSSRPWAMELEAPPPQLSAETALGAVQALSEKEDRRHYSPAGHLYPNSGGGLGVLEFLVVSGVYTLGPYELNAALFSDWEHDPAQVLVPDRFVAVRPAQTMSVEFQRVLIVNRVSLLTFAPGWAQFSSAESPYQRDRCRLLVSSPAQGAESWVCPEVGGVGFFPREVRVAQSKAQALSVIGSLPPAQLVDLAVLGPELDPALHEQGQARPAAGTIVSFERRGDELTYVLEVEQAGVFAIADTWFPGWAATVNGGPVPISRANVAFKAVRVPAGHVELRLHFSLERLRDT